MNTILHVEGDLNDVFFLGKAMQQVGVANAIQVVTDGQEAIDYLQGAGKFFDRGFFPLPCLVLLTLRLACMTGLEVLTWIRKQHSTCLPVIMFSASERDADIEAAYRLGANAFLHKPSDCRHLVDIANSIKEFWLTRNALPKESSPEAMISRGALSGPGRPRLPTSTARWPAK